MILIWRGWGLLAVVALFPFFASCGLIEVDPKWIITIAMSLSLLLGGAVCISCGMRWNRQRTEHSLYFVPLQVWGWIYWAGALTVALLAFVGGIFRMIQPVPGKPDPERPDPVYTAVGGWFGLIVVVAVAWAIVQWSRPPALRHATDEATVDGEP